ncbi:hypothetical protein [Arsenophonus endosymbiont of Aleurodicus floccissimus]|nr:hypothetical protein [Arsenophonus endosymbiont of Aleurodicus floccissimus]
MAASVALLLAKTFATWVAPCANCFSDETICLPYEVSFISNISNTG